MAEFYTTQSHGRWADDVKRLFEQDGLTEKKEGAINDFRVVWLETSPWSHATSEFRVEVTPALGPDYGLNGLGFRVHRDGTDTYKPLPAQSEGERWTFAVPESDAGDFLVFVFRISSRKMALFPQAAKPTSFLEIRQR